MITITISPQTGDQIRIIAAAMIELLNTPPAEVATAETPFTSPTPAATEPAKTRKKTATPAATEQPAPAATEQPAPAAPTLEEVRAKLTVFKDSGKSLKDLLATVDSPHLIAVPPERYSELLANMEKM
jgi:hypothetical protein